MKNIFIIVTYNSGKYIENCINSILMYEPESSICVIDNCSSDNTLFLLKNYKNIILFKLQENLGFGKANNIGLKYALEKKYDFVYLLNHDAFLKESIINKLKGHLKLFPEIGIISPMQLNPVTGCVEVNFKNFICESNFLEQFYDNYFKRTIHNIYIVDFFQAASWFIPIEVIKKVGVFDELFFHYGEDNNYINRIHFHKYKIGIATDLTIFHHGNPLNLIYLRNFNNYHLNRKKSGHLVKHTNINFKFDSHLYNSEIKNHIKFLIINIMQLRFHNFYNKVQYLVFIINIKRKIIESRNSYICVESLVK